MTIAEHPTCYADHAWCGQVEVVENIRIARDTYRLRMVCPEIAQAVLPGQFVMVRLPDGSDPLLGRPLALYDTYPDPLGNPQGIDVVYLVVGKLTSRLTQVRSGARLELWGPLGNGFQPRNIDHLIMVAGGIGQTPFVALGAEALGRKQYGSPPRHAARLPRITLCYGARTSELHAGVEDFRALGVDVRLSTDDGFTGHHGLVTELVEPLLAESNESPGSSRLHVVCCGPEPMLHAVAKLAARAGVSCDVSLETPMACGLGICFSCVTRVRDAAGGWDYRRTCVEGPVFDAQSIEF